MKINTKEFRRIVQNCSLINHGNLSVPVLKYLKYIKMEVKADSITLTSTNLNEWYSRIIKLDHGENFSLLIDTEQLLKVLKHIKSEFLEFSIIKDEKGSIVQLKIEAEMTFKITPDLEINNFPDVPFSRPKSSIKIFNKEKLFEIMNKICFSATKNNINKSYSGILFSQKEDHLELVTTDIHRLSLVDTKIAKTEKDFVISVDSAKNMMKIFNNQEINFMADSISVHVSSKDELYYSRALKDEFPDYNSVLNREQIAESWYEADKKALLQNLKSILNFHKKEKAIYTEFHFADKKLNLTAIGEDSDIIETSINLKTVNEDLSDLRIVALNARYIHEAINHMDNIRMNKSPGEFRKPFYLADIQPDYEFYHIVMPIKFRGL